MITYHVGDATRPDGDGEIAIVHVLSDRGVYGKGFALALAERHPRAKTRFQLWHKGDPDSGTHRAFRVGAVQWCAVGEDLHRPPWHRWVVNMVAQRGLRSSHNVHPLDLAALHECLQHVGEHARGPIVMPRIGCELAGGNWGEVEPIIAEHLTHQDVRVYDLPA